MNISIRNKMTTVTVALMTLPIFGCSESPESVFLNELKSKITDEGERCYSTKNMLDLEFLDSGGKRYLAVRSGSIMNAYKDSQARGKAMVNRLQQAGYLSGVTKNLKYNFGDWTGYELNDKGQEYIDWDKGVCVGRRNVTEIIEYTEPADKRGMTFTKVKYKYDVATNDIVNDLGLEEKVKAKMPGEGMATFVKTNKGWRLK